jgi:hypothetical protein
MANLARIVVNDAKKGNAKYIALIPTYISASIAPRMNHANGALNEALTIVVRNYRHQGNKPLNVNWMLVLLHTTKIQMRVPPRVFSPLQCGRKHMSRIHSSRYQIQED